MKMRNIRWRRDYVCVFDRVNEMKNLGYEDFNSVILGLNNWTFYHIVLDSLSEYWADGSNSWALSYENVIWTCNKMISKICFRYIMF